MRKYILLLICLLSSLGMWAQSSGTCGDNLTWQFNNGVLTISGTGEMKCYYPSGYPWDSYKALIQKIVIADGVTSMELGAFSYCTNLTSVTIPNSVTSISSYVFRHCSSLSSIDIPFSVRSIGYEVFDGCTNLNIVTCAAVSPPSLGDNVFENVPTSTATLYVHSMSIDAYKDAAQWKEFSNIKKLNSGDNIIDGTCGDNVTWELDLIAGILNVRGTGALNDTPYCPWYYLSKYIKYITIDNGVTSIGKSVFSSCNSLTSITIPNSVTSIGKGAFLDCSSLTSITIPNSVTSIGDGAFLDCSSLTSITIPNSVTSIGSNAFYNCISLISVNIPESVTSIGKDAFTFVGNIQYNGTATGSPWGAYTHNGFVEGNIIYSDKTKTELTYCARNANGEIIIPNTVNSISDYAFYRCSSLTSVTIPNSVSSIGNFAFYGCSSLNEVTSLMTSPAPIDGFTFSVYGTLHVPTCYKSIYEDRYTWKNFTIVEEEPSPEDLIGSNCLEYSFSSISATVKQASGGNLYSGDIVIPAIVLNNGAYYRVTGISYRAFNSCSGLTSVTIPNSVTSIENYAFSDCSSLASITIPNSVTSIASYAFYNCPSLPVIDNIRYADTYLVKVVDKTLSTYTIKPEIRFIGERAFYGCDMLSITIPNSVTSIESSAFYDIGNIQYTGTATGSPWGAHTVNGYIEGNLVYSDETKTELTYCSRKATGEIVIPNSVTSIGSSAFSGCSGLTSITIPNSVTSIGSSVFSGCSGLTSITIPNSVTSIGIFAFDDIPNIQYSGTATGSPWGAYTVNGYVEENFIYSDEAKTILTYCSREATGEIVIPNSVTSIGSGAFVYCSGLTSIAIPNSVTSIGTCAFAECIGLTSVTIPNSVTSLGSSAFENCTSLKSIDISNGITSIESDTFSSCSSLTSVVVPEGVTSLGNFAFSGCTSLTSIVLPSTLNKLKDFVFSASPISDITIFATTPPAIYNNLSFTFRGFDYANCTLHVLPGCKEIYKNAGDWGLFTIVEDAGQTQHDVARIGETTYATLAEAITAAGSMRNPTIEMTGQDNATDAVSLSNATLIFPEGTSYAGTITVNAGGVLDMQGGSIIVNANEAVHVNSGSLRMSAGIITNTMVNKDAIYARNDGRVYISGGTITGTRYAMMINGDTSRSGVVEVTGGNFVRQMTGANDKSHGSVIYNWDASYAPEGYMRLTYDAQSATLALTEDYAAICEGKWAFDSFPQAMSSGYVNICLTSEYVADAKLDVRKQLTIAETGTYTGSMIVYNTYSLTVEGAVNGTVSGYSGSTINIHGGSVTADDNTSVVDIRATLNMTSGKITNLSTAANSTALIIKSGATSVNIEDGIFTGVKGLTTDATINVCNFVHGGKYSNNVTKLANVVEEGLLTTQEPVDGYYTLVRAGDAVAEDKTLTINFPVDNAIYNVVLDQYPDCQFSYIDMSGDQAYTTDDVVLRNEAHTNGNTFFHVKNESFASETNVICNGSAQTVHLTNSYPYVMPVQINNVGSISFTRNYSVAEWSDMYLPFDVPAETETYRVAEIWDTEVEKQESAVAIEFITLDEGEYIPANTPAIIKPRQTGELTIRVEDATLYASQSRKLQCSTTREIFDFVGVCENTTLLDKKGWFFQASSQQFRFVSSPTAYLQPFRFYMTIADKSTGELEYGNTGQQTRFMFYVIGDEDVVTGINTAGTFIEDSNKVYNMKGQLIQKPHKGLFIANGKKLLINK